MQTAGVAQQIFDKTVKNLPVIERLQLVKLILDDLMSDPTTWVVDEGDVWSEQDHADLTRASLAYAAQSAWEETA